MSTAWSCWSLPSLHRVWPARQSTAPFAPSSVDRKLAFRSFGLSLQGYEGLLFLRIAVRRGLEVAAQRMVWTARG